MLVLHRVGQHHRLGGAIGQMIKVGAGVELHLVADNVAMPLPLGAVTLVSVNRWPSSTSVSLARTSTVSVWFSVPEPCRRPRPARHWSP